LFTYTMGSILPFFGRAKEIAVGNLSRPAMSQEERCAKLISFISRRNSET